MMLQISKKAFKEALDTIGNFISPKPKIPALSDIRIKASNDSLELYACNYSSFCKFLIKMDDEVQGNLDILTPAYNLINIVNKMPEGNIAIDFNEALILESTGLHYRLVASSDCSDFPEVKAIDNGFFINGKELKDAINSIKFAIDTNAYSGREINYSISSIYLMQNGKTLEFYSTDGKRLAKYAISIDAPEDFSCLISVDHIKQLLGILDRGDYKFSYDENIFSLSNEFIVANFRKLDASYPDCNEIIAEAMKSSKITSIVDKKALKDSLQRLSIIDYRFHRVSVNISDDIMSLTSEDPSFGYAREMLNVDNDGNISFIVNASYMLGMFNLFDGEKLNMRFKDDKSPIVVASDDASKIFLLMPMQK